MKVSPIQTWSIVHSLGIVSKRPKLVLKTTGGRREPFITLLYPSNMIKFKISKSRTSTDFINHLKNIRNYVKKNRKKRFILITDNASISQSHQFTYRQSDWLTVIFLTKRPPNLNPVETRVDRNLKKDV